MQEIASLASPETGLGFRRHVAEGDGAHLSPASARVLSILLPPRATTRVSVSGDSIMIAVRITVLATAISLSFITVARAEPAKSIGAVVVTANRVEQPASEVLAAVTVITRADIELSQAPDLLSLLARQPGIDQVRTGGTGSVSTINTRGSNSNHTLILIDGLRVNSAVQGLFDLAHLPLAQIDRIEIVRGPRAALWGSDAIGGVIHIFTRDASGPYLEAHAGSYGHASLDAGTGMAAGDRHFSVGAGREVATGFSASNPESGPFVFDPDKDGYRNNHGNFRIRDRVGSQELSLVGGAVNAETEYDQGVSRIHDRQLGLRLAGELRSGWSHELLVGYNHDDVHSTETFFQFGFQSSRTSLDWLNHLSLNEHQQLQLGVNWSREAGSADDSFLGSNFDLDRRNTGLFTTWTGQFAAHRLEFSLRHDDNSQFGGVTTGNAAWGWQISDETHLRASWGQGFRAPNFNELYYPGFFGSFAGNPNLDPERSTSAEIGIDWRMDGGQTFGVSAYRTRVSDLIAFQGDDFSAINIAHARLDGIEAEYRRLIGAWTFSANAGWQRAEDADSGDALLRRAPRKAHASLDYRFGSGLSLGFDADAVSGRPDFDFNAFPAARITLGGYALLGFRVAKPLGGGWQAEARVENLADRNYTLAKGYNTPGRSGMLGLRWEGQ
jgi:vitamin B12 transporter